MQTCRFSPELFWNKNESLPRSKGNYIIHLLWKRFPCMKHRQTACADKLPWNILSRRIKVYLLFVCLFSRHNGRFYTSCNETVLSREGFRAAALLLWFPSTCAADCLPARLIREDEFKVSLSGIRNWGGSDWTAKEASEGLNKGEMERARLLASFWCFRY